MERNDDLLIVGSIAFDSVETPAGSTEKALGGSASFASLAASYHCRPLMVGVVGEDFGDEHMEMFSAHGIDTKGIEKAPGLTFHWRGRYRENFKERDTLETCLNVFESFDPSLPEEYRNARYVFLGNIDPRLQAKVLGEIEDARITGMDTMNFWIQNSREELVSVLGRVDILFINDEEALELSGRDSVLLAAEDILGLGPRYVVIKRGEFGAILFGDDLRIFVPAVLLPRVIDPTGAGDAFAGGFMGYLAGSEELDRRSITDAMLQGTVLASFAVEDFSVSGLSGLTGDDVQERLTALRKMIPS
jgi:sugar/nucleoside kinase (ribokinase family)